MNLIEFSLDQIYVSSLRIENNLNLENQQINFHAILYWTASIVFAHSVWISEPLIGIKLRKFHLCCYDEKFFIVMR